MVEDCNAREFVFQEPEGGPLRSIVFHPHEGAILEYLTDEYAETVLGPEQFPGCTYVGKRDVVHTVETETSARLDHTP